VPVDIYFTYITKEN